MSWNEHVPFKPGVSIDRACPASPLTDDFPAVQVSAHASLEDIQREFDIGFFGLLSVPPLDQVPLMNDFFRDVGSFEIGILRLTIPAAIGHGIVFEKKYGALDAVLLVTEKGVIDQFSKWMVSTFFADPSGRLDRMRLQMTTVPLTDLLKLEMSPAAEPAKVTRLHVPALCVLGNKLSYVYRPHLSKLIPGAVIAKLCLEETPTTAVADTVVRRLFTGESDPYGANEAARSATSPGAVAYESDLQGRSDNAGQDGDHADPAPTGE